MQQGIGISYSDIYLKKERMLIVMSKINIKRGQLIWVDFKERSGSCQSGKRPAVVIQNNVGNRFSTTTTVIPITTKDKNNLPVHTKLKRSYDIANKGDVIMAEQLTVIDKSQILKIGDVLDNADIKAIEKTMLIQLSLDVNIA